MLLDAVGLCRHAAAGGQLRPVRGYGVRAEGGQRSHGVDVLLAEHATVQPGAGQGQDAGRQEAEEHHQPHAPAEAAHHADETHLSQLGNRRPGNRLDHRRVLLDRVPGAVPALLTSSSIRRHTNMEIIYFFDIGRIKKKKITNSYIGYLLILLSIKT